MSQSCVLWLRHKSDKKSSYGFGVNLASNHKDHSNKYDDRHVNNIIILVESVFDSIRFEATYNTTRLIIIVSNYVFV